MDDKLRTAKLAKLLDIEGYDDIADLLAAVIGDSISPAICSADDCDNTEEMEPDQTRGHCSACGRNTMIAAPVLAGVI